jgi:hypothetical protein
LHEGIKKPQAHPVYGISFLTIGLHSILLIRSHQCDVKGSALSCFAVESNFAFVFFDDAKAHGEPQPCALPYRLGGKERVEQTGFCFFGYA